MPRPKRKISQKKIARELGISQALVSLALNGIRERMHVATYDRIWTLALQRGYRPKGMHFPASPAARPAQVALILRAPLRLYTPSHYFGHVQQALHTALQQHGLAPVFMGAEDQLDAATLPRAFPAGHAFQSAVVLGEVSRRFLDRLCQLNLRVVTVGARYPGLSHAVLADEREALGSLVQHLHSLGHRRFGWIGGHVALGRHDARLRALETSLANAGLQIHPRYRLTLPAADRAEGAEGVHLLKPQFARRDFPTAFICYNSLMAAGALRAFEREGCSIPRDLSIASAGFANAGLSPLPRITAAGSNPEKIGEAAARLIASFTAQTELATRFTELVIPAQFAIGETTATAPRDFRTLRPRELGWTKNLAA